MAGMWGGNDRKEAAFSLFGKKFQEPGDPDGSHWLLIAADHFLQLLNCFLRVVQFFRCKMLADGEGAAQTGSAEPDVLRAAGVFRQTRGLLRCFEKEFQGADSVSFFAAIFAGFPHASQNICISFTHFRRSGIPGQGTVNLEAVLQTGKDLILAGFFLGLTDSGVVVPGCRQTDTGFRRVFQMIAFF